MYKHKYFIFLMIRNWKIFLFGSCKVFVSCLSVCVRVTLATTVHFQQQKKLPLCSFYHITKLVVFFLLILIFSFVQNYFLLQKKVPPLPIKYSPEHKKRLTLFLKGLMNLDTELHCILFIFCMVIYDEIFNV